MTDQYDVLEKSLLGDHTGLVASNNDSISTSERHPYLYLSCLTVTALLGYGFLFAFPLTFLFFAASVPGAIIDATNKLDVVLVLTSIVIASVAAWMSYYLYKLRPPLPAGRPLAIEEAPLLYEYINDACKLYRSPQVHMVRIVSDYHVEIIKTPKNGFPLLYTNTLLIGLPVFQSLSPKQ